MQNTVNWLMLPYEVWLEILTCCDLAAKDLLHLELTCTYFKGKSTKSACIRLRACDVFVKAMD